MAGSVTGDRTASVKYVYELPYTERKMLCNILDMDNQWERLGGEFMGFTVHQLYEMRRSERCGESPCDRLLQMWGHQNKSVANLYSLLYKMDHYQAMRVLLPFIPTKYHSLALQGEQSLTAALPKPNTNTGVPLPSQLQHTPSVNRNTSDDQVTSSQKTNSRTGQVLAEAVAAAQARHSSATSATSSLLPSLPKPPAHLIASSGERDTSSVNRNPVVQAAASDSSHIPATSHQPTRIQSLPTAVHTTPFNPVDSHYSNTLLDPTNPTTYLSPRPSSPNVHSLPPYADSVNYNLNCLTPSTKPSNKLPSELLKPSPPDSSGKIINNKSNNNTNTTDPKHSVSCLVSCDENVTKTFLANVPNKKMQQQQKDQPKQEQQAEQQLPKKEHDFDLEYRLMAEAKLAFLNAPAEDAGDRASSCGGDGGGGGGVGGGGSGGSGGEKVTVVAADGNGDCAGGTSGGGGGAGGGGGGAGGGGGGAGGGGGDAGGGGGGGRSPLPPSLQLPGASDTGNRKISNTSDVSAASSDASSTATSASVPVISYAELTEATDKWHADLLLGRGGFGSVYRGTWKNTEVAVKRIHPPVDGGDVVSPLHIAQTLEELRLLQAYRHDNILQLYGYSADPGQPACLVYQFMINGSVEDKLLRRRPHRSGGRGSTSPVVQTPIGLDWSQRLIIARGTARALQFLHTVKEKPLIHGDIKSANILLDRNLEPKLGDFGLAREGPMSNYTSMKVSRVHGTKPYIPDEYLRDKKLSTKVDCYSYGVVLFELLTGLRAYDEKRTHYKYLKELVCDHEFTVEALQDVKAGPDTARLCPLLLTLGKECVAKIAKKRPDMTSVYRQLANFALPDTFPEQAKRLSLGSMNSYGSSAHSPLHHHNLQQQQQWHYDTIGSVPMPSISPSNTPSPHATTNPFPSLYRPTSPFPYPGNAHYQSHHPNTNYFPSHNPSTNPYQPSHHPATNAYPLHPNSSQFYSQSPHNQPPSRSPSPTVPTHSPLSPHSPSLMGTYTPCMPSPSQGTMAQSPGHGVQQQYYQVHELQQHYQHQSKRHQVQQHQGQEGGGYEGQIIQSPEHGPAYSQHAPVITASKTIPVMSLQIQHQYYNQLHEYQEHQQYDQLQQNVMPQISISPPTQPYSSVLNATSPTVTESALPDLSALSLNISQVQVVNKKTNTSVTGENIVQQQQHLHEELHFQQQRDSPQLNRQNPSVLIPSATVSTRTTINEEMESGVILPLLSALGTKSSTQNDISISNTHQNCPNTSTNINRNNLPSSSNSSSNSSDTDSDDGITEQSISGSSRTALKHSTAHLQTISAEGKKSIFDE